MYLQYFCVVLTLDIFSSDVRPLAETGLQKFANKNEARLYNSVVFRTLCRLDMSFNKIESNNVER